MAGRLTDAVRRRLQGLWRNRSIGKPFAARPTWRVAVVTVASCCAVFILVLGALWLAAARGGHQAAPGVTIDLPPVEATAALSVPSPDADGGLTVPALNDAAFARLPVLATEAPSPAAPDPALIQTTAAGRLPTIAADGRLPRAAYARPFDQSDDRAKLAVVVAGIGLARAASDAAIARLPGAVDLAIDAYATGPEHWARRARQAGHEILATVPMERADFPFGDAGSRALRLAAGAEENKRRLDTILGSLAGYVRVLAVGGTAFARNDAAVEPMLQTLRARGLLVVTAAAEFAPGRPNEDRGPPVLRADAVIDEDGGAAAIDRQLADLAATAARERSGRIVLAYPSPLTLDRIRAWIAGLDNRRLVLAPVSALVQTKDRG